MKKIKTNIHLEFLNRSLENKELNPLIAACYRGAVEALEKEIPNKPIYDSTTSPGICPKCFKDDINILLLTTNDKEILNRVNYCPNCGQKLDWEE